MSTSISVLGPTTITADGEAVELRSVRQRRLVAALVLAGGRVRSADSLAEAVWGDDLPANPGGALQNLISRLRSALGSGADVIETTPAGYRLVADAVDVDAVGFERRVHEARSMGSSARAGNLEAAVAMWRGEAYEDLDTDQARVEVTRLTELRLTAEEDAAAALADAGELDVALPALEAFCAREPLRERPRLDLARALAASGRRAEALRVLDDLRRVLAAELGIEPSAAAAALYGAVLAEEQPDPRAAAVDRMPSVLSPVFGREDDMAGVQRRLATARIVTLVGPGGVGKTTLALLVAASVGPSYEHGCRYIDLSAVRDAAEVPSAFARGLAIDVRDPAKLIDRMLEALTHRHVLLVIDNAEQVVARVGDTVSRLVAYSDGVDVLVTSRAPLNISGERIWPVEPLAATNPDDAAIRLFWDRAEAVRPGWEPDGEELAAAAGICRRLDGLPLAVELAAAHARFRSCQEIMAELDRPLDLLVRSTSPVTRHSGLRVMADWSYELLQPLDAAIFDRLSVFAAGFTRQSARGLCDDLADPQQVDVVLDGLVDRSLIRLRPRPDGSRYSLLEPLRQYGLAHLVEGAQETVAEERHAVVLLELVEDADASIAGPDEARWVALLDDERADLVAACRWLADHDVDAALRLVQAVYFYAFPRGRADVMELPEMVLSAASPTAKDANRSRWAVVYGLAADRALVAGDLVRARELLDLGFAAASGDVAEAADRYCHGAAGDLALFTGATAEAAGHYRASAAGFRAVGNESLAAWVTAVGVLPDVYGGEPSVALASATEAVRATDATHCPSAKAVARYVRAEASASHDTAAARHDLDEAIRLADSVGADYVAGLAHLSLATLEARIGDAAGAMPHYAALLDMWRRSGNWAQQWNTLRTLVVVLADLDRPEDAVRLLAGIDANAQAPSWGEDHGRLVAAEQRAHQALGGSRFDRAWREGSSASSIQALALAQAAVEDALRPR